MSSEFGDFDRVDLYKLVIQQVAAELEAMVERKELRGGLGYCVIGSRMVHEVLRYFGVANDVVKVACVIVNKRFVELLEADKITMDQTLPDWAVEDGAWAIGLGTPIGDDPGLHLVVVTKRDGWLFDPTLGQASRPHRNMPLQEDIFLLEDHKAWMQQQVTALYQGSDGQVLTYRRMPDTKAWMRSPDWKAYLYYKGNIGKVIREIRSEL